MNRIREIQTNVARLNLLLNKQAHALETVDALAERIEKTLSELYELTYQNVRAVPNSEMRQDFNDVRRKFVAVVKRFKNISRKAKLLKYEGE